MTENIGISSYCNIKGVTCYMNSILSILQQTPIFADYIVSTNLQDKLYEKNQTTKKEDIESIFNETTVQKTQFSRLILDQSKIKINDLDSCFNETAITFQLYKLFKISMTHNNFKITPTSFRKTISMKNDMWGENIHQDSQEFLTFLISSMEEEISDKVIFIPGMNFERDVNNINLSYSLMQIIANKEWERNIKNEYSLIKTLFTGMTRMKTTCNYCMNESNSFEIFQTLQLSIPRNANTLEDCMNNFIMDEILDKDNMIRCNLCYYMNRSTKNTVIWKTPQILIIHLKRFIVNQYGMPSQKISKMILYPLILDFSKYVDIMSPDINNCKYSLFAVNCHYSLGYNNINSGHYISYVKNRMNDSWYEFDDSNIKKIKNIITDKAYMLFYMRMK
jgi:ubiquitin carboxyl-terminal hydrolase 8